MESELVVTEVERSIRLESGCFIVEIDELKILVNFGIDMDFNINIYKNIESIRGITHILLCSSDIYSIGGLIYLESLGIQAVIIGTVPIKILGRIEVIERIETLKEFYKREDFNKGVEEAFDQIVPLKYMQTYALNDEVTVQPLNSGSSTGGAIWKIRKNDQEWVIFDKCNHRKEAHLDGADISNIQSPVGVIVNSIMVRNQKITRKERDKELLSIIENTLERKGKVFIPVTYTQLLEISMTIYNALGNEKQPSMSLYSFYGKKYIESVKTILEWTGSSVLQSFNQEKENPFNLLKLSFYNECLENKIEGQIVFVIDREGTSGFSPVILPIIAQGPENTIIRVSESIIYTENNNNTVLLPEIKYIQLTESEILSTYKRTKEEQDKQETQKKIDDLVKRKIEDSSEEEDRTQILTKFWHQIQEEIETPEPQNTYKSIDIDLTATEIMFPNPSRRKPSDEYGERIIFHKEKEEELQLIELQPQEIKKKTHKLTIGTPTKITIQAQIHQVLFTGEYDIFNFRALLTQISPQKLIVHGERPADRKILYNYLLYSRIAPETLELINRQDITTIRKTLPIKIHNDILQTINMHVLGNSAIGYFHGEMKQDNNSVILVPLPLDNHKENICLSTIKLSNLRKLFIESKIKAEIIDQKLVVNKNIFIYQENNNLVIDGEISKEFYSSKRLLSKHIAFIST
ncbi:cleavage and polyadenylation specificity factor subunit 2 [Nematocida sp. AWRm80]|nr:cleavage and polyadenylation specificity factor subunit 2 [Nematocida sp. AWRm80]